MRITRSIGFGVFLIITYLLLNEAYSAASATLVQFFETTGNLIEQVDISASSGWHR